MNSSNSNKIDISLIWAQACDKEGKPGAIGFRGQMPWHLSEDMKNFARLTTGHPVIMGRNTWNSLPERFRPLPCRHNIVLSPDCSSVNMSGSDVVTSCVSVATSIDHALAIARDGDPVGNLMGIDRSQVWIIGGGYVYSEFLSLAARAIITQIDARYQVDTYAPDLDALVASGEWRVGEYGQWQIPMKESEIKRYRFVEYSRMCSSQ